MACAAHGQRPAHAARLWPHLAPSLHADLNHILAHVEELAADLKRVFSGAGQANFLLRASREEPLPIRPQQFPVDEAAGARSPGEAQRPPGLPDERIAVDLAGDADYALERLAEIDLHWLRFRLVPQLEAIRAAGVAVAPDFHRVLAVGAHIMPP